MDNNNQVTTPHDKIFRALMEYQEFSVAFFRQYLPAEITEVLEPESLELLKETHLDKALQKTMNDLVFSCRLKGKEAYLTLLVEHQSSPDEFIAFRIYHYLFSVLHSHLKQHPKKPLPPIYALLFYHGEDTPYPYSLNLLDNFDDPLHIMQKTLFQPVPIVDVNQIPDEALKKQEWVGALSMAMKYIRTKEMTPYALEVLKILPAVNNARAREILYHLLVYLFNSGNIEDMVGFIEASEQLPDPTRSEIMSLAAKLEARGKAEGKTEGKTEGKAEGKAEVAINMLKEGADPAFVAKVANLSTEEIKRLQTSLKGEQ